MEKKPAPTTKITGKKRKRSGNTEQLTEDYFTEKEIEQIEEKNFYFKGKKITFLFQKEAELFEIRDESYECDGKKYLKKSIYPVLDFDRETGERIHGPVQSSMRSLRPVLTNSGGSAYTGRGR